MMHYLNIQGHRGGRGMKGPLKIIRKSQVKSDPCKGCVFYKKVKPDDELCWYCNDFDRAMLWYGFCAEEEEG